MKTRRRRRLAAAALSLTLAAAACGAPAEPEQPHGYVAGAEELPEAQTAIAYAARGARELHLLDLSSESEKTIVLSLGAQQLTEDGRLLYITDGDRRLEIVDAGVWTVDHTDHVHYYRAPARAVGTLTFDAAIETVAGFGAHTTIGTADGRVTVLDRRRLEAGQVVESARFETGGSAPLAVPFADHLLVAARDRIVATAADGRETGASPVPCRAPRGWAALRGGAVVACDNHLVRVKHEPTGLTAKVLPSPRTPIPPSGLGYRPRSNEAAVAGRTGIWSVNAAKATLRHLPAGRDLVTAASPADGSTVLALDRSGTLLAYDLGTGKAVAEAPLRATSLTLDVNRAYLGAPDAGVIYEVDYRDRLRTARTLRAAVRPDLMVEVGR